MPTEKKQTREELLAQLEALRRECDRLKLALVKREPDEGKGFNSQELLTALSNVQSEFIVEKDSRTLFAKLLSELLRLTGSEYGFIGEILTDDTDTPYLKTHAITNIAWNEEWREFYRQNAPHGLEFRNLDTLFGAAMTTGKPVMSNDPANDPRRGGLPEGHPPLNAFLGLPLYRGQKMVGLIGIANRPGGYDENLVHDLEPMTTTCGYMIDALRTDRCRKAAEAAQRLGERRMEAILNTAADGIITIDQEGIIQSINPAAEKMFDYAAEAVIGRKVNMLMPSPHRESHDTYLRNYLTTGKSRIIGIGREVPAQRRDGSTFPVELGLSEVKTEQGSLFTGILRDITERKEAEAKLADVLDQVKKGRDELLALMNMLHIGIVVLDSAGRISFLNQPARDIAGHQDPEPTGRTWSEAFPFGPEDRAAIEKMLATGNRRKRPAQLDSASGRRCWLEVEVQDAPRAAGRKILVLYDVTEVQALRHRLDERARFHDLVGESDSMRDIYRRIQDVAGVDWTVLIEGQTGTGKELVARAIHAASSRAKKPFVAVNCAGLTDELLNSQLFGHRRGAFTGAMEDHKGFFEAAMGGTLFLDEIGDISRQMQISLLRVLETKEITRLGETQPRKVDIRILTATHRDLTEEVARGAFRHDLIYRLRVARISLPPLQERRVDIPLLIRTFLSQSSAATGKKIADITSDAMRLLLDYPWPGNVRELKSAMDFATLHSQGTIIEAADLPPEIRQGNAIRPAVPVDPDDERQEILDALKRARGKRTEAARLLGMSRATFYRRLEQLNIKISRTSAP